MHPSIAQLIDKINRDFFEPNEIKYVRWAVKTDPDFPKGADRDAGIMKAIEDAERRIERRLKLFGTSANRLRR